ncbi:MAG: hypothetical protein Kow0037_04380 [Calditrichia bacterium]
MDNLLILIEIRQNRKLIREFLDDDFRILSGAPTGELLEFADLVIADGPSLKKSGEDLQACKDHHQEKFLPVLAIIQKKDVQLVTASLWKYVDELIFMPIEKIELLARIRILLRARRLSQEVNDKYEALRLYHYTLAHDLRAHVRAVNGFSGIILEDYGKQIPAEAAEFAQKIRDVALDMNGLIDTVLKFQKLDIYRPVFKSVKLNWLVKKVIAIFEMEIKEKKAKIKYGDLDFQVRADPYLLQFILQNIIGNALKFYPSDKTPVVEVGAEKRGFLVRIKIKDEGIGIAEADQQRIFEPLVRLHSADEYHGYGLGLAVVRRLIDVLDGKLGLKSKPGEGSTFWIELQGDDHENHDH